MASCLASCQPARFIIPTPTIGFQMRGHSASLLWERTVRPLERQLRQQMLFLLLRSTLRCPHRELWELNGSISHFPLAASKRPILLLPRSFIPQACAGPALGLLTTLCITHARQVTVERVTLATQAWPSNAAPGFSLEIGFISV